MDSFRLFQLAYLCLFPSLLIAQTPKQQEIAMKEEISLIIFDTDMGSDCDDVGALAIRSQEFGSKDWNFFRNETQPYTDYLLKNFPRPIYFINAGSDVLTGQSLVHAPSGTIVRTAYRDWLWKNEQKTLWEGRPSWDLAAVCFAVEGPNSFFEPPESGILHFDFEKGSIWEKIEGGNHFYVNQRQGVSTAFGRYLNSLLH
ncbi:MAG: hypothetical protein AAGA10_18565 [Bacteroidota bacterium]